MATYGYARISTPKQDIERQVRNLLAYDPGMVLYKEQYSARTNARPRFARLLARVRKSDTIVFDEVSRMSRNASEGFETYKSLYERGIDLVFLKDRGMNTDVYRLSDFSDKRYNRGSCRETCLRTWDAQRVCAST